MKFSTNSSWAECIKEGSPGSPSPFRVRHVTDHFHHAPWHSWREAGVKVGRLYVSVAARLAGRRPGGKSEEVRNRGRKYGRDMGGNDLPGWALGSVRPKVHKDRLKGAQIMLKIILDNPCTRCPLYHYLLSH